MSTFFAEVNKYSYSRCTSCKTIYIQNKLYENKLNIYYRSSFSYGDGRINEPVIRKRAQIILKQLHKINPQMSTLCDVGSGFGFFIDEAHKEGYKVEGIEPSKQLSTYSINRFGQPVFQGTLAEYCKLYSKTFDCVTCVHTIEHIVNPRVFLRNLSRILNKNGVLFIETPNADSHLVYAEKDKYTFLLAPEHPWVFSKFTFRLLVGKQLKMFRTNTYTYSEHVMGILKAIIIKKKNKTQSITSSNLKKSDLTERMSIRKIIQYILLDRLLAKLLCPLFNINDKGSILELYIKKKN